MSDDIEPCDPSGKPYQSYCSVHDCWRIVGEDCWVARAEKAEAAIQRVRELHCLYDEHWPHCNRCHEVYPCDTIQALDGGS